MTNIDINKPNKKEEIQEQPKETQMQKAWRHFKVLSAYTLMLATAASFLLYNMEKKARSMDRENYKQQIEELKSEATKAQEKLETSLLTQRPQSAPSNQ
jgi:hypothetical protein